MKQRLLELADNLGGSRVLVIGDYMLDRYLWGRATCMSPEAPVPVVRVEREEHQPGGAGNVVRNLCALGVEPIALGTVGRDRFGEDLRGRLELLGAGTDGLIAAEDPGTTVKTRVIAGGQQMLRIDDEGEAGLPDELATEIADRSVELLSTADAVIFSDYAKGVCSRRLVCQVVDASKAVASAAASEQAGDRLLLADAKPAGFSQYEGLTLLTPNESEAREVAGLLGLAVDSLEELARRVREQMQLEALVITRGARGLLLVEAEGDAHHLPGVPAEVVDVTGAGDTVLSVMAAALLAGASMLEAAVLGNLAGGIVVQRVGCSTVNAEELARRIRTQAEYLERLR